MALSYNLITPVKNEEEHLPKLADCVVKQSCSPEVWVIVDDASKDRTPQIIEQLIARHKWIHTVRVEEDNARNFGAHFAELVRIGLERSVALAAAARYVIKVDADVRFHSDTFRVLCETMDERANIAIASPRLMTLTEEIDPEELLSPAALLANSRRVIGTDKSRTNEPTDGIRVYRKDFLDEIGGFPISDASADIVLGKAVIRGYSITFVDNVWGCLTRQSGTTLKSDYTRGKLKGYRQYIAHYHPLLVMASIVWDTFSRPMWALGSLEGYLGSIVKRKKRIDDPDVIRYYGRERFKKVLEFIAWRVARQPRN